MEDFLLLDHLFNKEDIMIRDTTLQWIEKNWMPIITDCYEKAEFPKALIPDLATLGILGMTVPSEYGGTQINAIAYGLVCQALEMGDSGLRSFVSVQSALCMYPILTFGSEKQKQTFLPEMAKGKCIGCFGLTEPDSGSDPASMKTHAKKTNGGWILNGSKIWITNATLADLAIVWAKTEDGIRGFIVEKSFDGFEAKKITHKMSMRASDTGELFFSDCFVPDSHYLPGSECGLKAPLSCLSQARYGIAWGATGAAISCFDTTLRYLKERPQFNKPLAGFQLIQKELADMFTEIMKLQLLNIRLGQLKDNQQITPTMISMGKMTAVKNALDIARRCRNLLGANGISLEYHVIRHMTNLESVFTYEGTDNVHHLVIGKHITGINAFV